MTHDQDSGHGDKIAAGAPIVTRSAPEDMDAAGWSAMSTAEKFERFHEMNPHVYRVLVTKAREWNAAGHGKLGMSLLFGMVRWVLALETKGDPHRINDHYVPYYSRLIQFREADLRGIFDTRSSPEADAWIAAVKGRAA